MRDVIPMIARSGQRRSAWPLRALLAVLCASSSPCARAADPARAPPTADEVLRRSDDAMDPGEATADLELVVRRQGEQDRVYRMKLLTGSRDKMLVYFQYPPRDKGQAFLRIGEDFWLYVPGVSRTMRIPKRQAFAGGDFSNYDVLSLRLQQHYDARIEGEESIDGEPCYRLLLTARTSGAPYSSIRTWIRKDNFWPVRREYNTLGHDAFKVLVFQAKRSKTRPDTYVMTDILERTKSSELTWSHLKAAKHDQQVFTESYLSRRR